ncbi:lipid biosynthesis B12-binding/radical SAM protein [Desulfopila sp. IMCC35008]|uniref:lipid biosynthesis B12-binding/radical SAM protein n=1 Tax=Desulfopila sp. IMCC35008 TaxID=2653858 RepID=UPI0013CF454E|nr:lipid biosynthesis B12-binding/radical SAM protein [Desulfopila sp. IMCC35008]
MADCLIISANQVVTPYPVYPLGAAYVTEALQRNGHAARHFDLLADGGLAALEELLITSSFDLIGISIRNLDTVDSADPAEFLDDIKVVARSIRTHSNAPLVLGGPAFSIIPEPLMTLLEADYGVVGEGEDALVRLASAVENGSPPSTKIISSNAVVEQIGAAGITESTARYYLDHGGMLNVQTKRGCAGLCSYCSYPAIEGRRIRYRDPVEVVDEVESLVSRHDARYLFFADSVFNDPAKRYLRVAEELLRRDLALQWCAFFRPTDITTEELRLLKRSGLAAMELGTDAVCDETLAGLRKGFGFDDVVQVHDRILAEDIPCAHFVMFGGPGENRSTLARGLANIERLEGSVVFAFIGIRILPGTPIYHRAVTDGIVEPGEVLLRPKFYYSPQISQHEIKTELVAAFEKRQEWVYPCHEFNDRINILHRMGRVGPLWDLLLTRRKR